ncbi:PAS domain S-box protein [Geomonas sp.]|uniref:PAS domain S-box protein n=1 Tax=Geomonas sp. TaxID=2651584 RepID=UPI002B48FF82|nr:PAS domain S-box protein [Geomonas sp.]HJV33807.1 PAS domain S-box protein [Geomonas sp.]
MNDVFVKSESLLLTPRAYLVRLLSAVLALNIFVLGLTAFFLHKSRVQDETRVAIQAQNLSQSLSQTMAGIIDKTDLSLLYLKREMERQLRRGGIDQQFITQLLLDERQSIPELDGIRIADAKGDIIFRDRPDPVGGPLNIADREHFQFARENPQAGIIISKPLTGRHSHKWQVNIDRRINNPDGSFAGIVFGSISLEYISRLFASFDIGKMGVLTLRQDDMTVVVRYPDLPNKSSTGSKTVSRQLAEMVAAGRTSGTYRNPGSIDPVERIFAFNKIAGYPLYITCGRAPSDYLASWRNELKQTAVLVAIFACGTFAAAWLLYQNRRRIAAADALTNEYDYLRTLFEHNGSGHLVVSSSREILQVNQFFCELFGYAEAELVGKTAEMLHIDRQHFENFTPVLEKARDGRSRTSVEYPWRRKDGSVFWCIFTGVRLQLPNGDTGVVWSVIDITERKEIEAALKASESNLATIFQESPLALSVSDLETGQFTEVNLSLLRLMRASSDQEMVGKCSIELGIVAPEERARLVKQVREQKRIDHFVTMMSRLDGEPFIAELFTNSYMHGQRRYLLTCIMDITERKQIEAALTESEELFRSIMALSPDIISIISADGVLRYNSPAALAIHGYHPEELVGTNTFELIHPDDQHQVTTAFERLLADPTKPAVVQYRYLGKSGQYTWMEATGINQLDNPVIRGIVAISRDIEDRKKVEQEHLRLEKQLLHAQKLESLGILAGGIAHDFNNLLTAIMGNLDLALLRVPQGLPARDNLEQSMLASRRAAELTRQMLAYAGKGVFQKQAVDLNEIVVSNTDLFRTVIPRTISFNVAVQDDLPKTMADPSQLQQIVMNLITNAAEAIGTDPGVINLATGAVICERADIQQSVLAEKPDPGMFVFIEVEDNGMGMNEEIRQRLFDPFFTTKFTGRGLGMAAAQGIVRAHHGMIMLESTEGKGTKFRILFPVLPAEETAAEEAATAQDGVPAMAETARNKILIVDDEEYVRSLGVEYARHFGYQPLEACNGVEAIEIYKEQGSQIAVVVLDLTMPVMDGVATFVELKKLDSEVRILLSSGYSEQTISDRFPGEKPCGFLQKPFQARDFEQKIRQALPS